MIFIGAEPGHALNPLTKHQVCVRVAARGLEHRIYAQGRATNRKTFVPVGAHFCALELTTPSKDLRTLSCLDLVLLVRRKK